MNGEESFTKYFPHPNILFARHSEQSEKSSSLNKEAEW